MARVSSQTGRRGAAAGRMPWRWWGSSRRARITVLGVATLAVLSVVAAVVIGNRASSAPTRSNRAAPAVGSCLHLGSAHQLTGATVVDCPRAHQGQVFALIGLPPGLRDPAAAKQLDAVRASLTCPDLTGWLGYAGVVPVGVLQTWRFPTRAQIAAGARWAACVAVRAPGPDHDTLVPMVGSYQGKLAGAKSPLPQLGRCAATHTNRRWIPEACRAGSSQWVWLGAHRRPAGAYPGVAPAKKSAHVACDRLTRAHGGPRAFVYYPDAAASWAKAQTDWSCWAPLAQITG